MSYRESKYSKLILSPNIIDQQMIFWSIWKNIEFESFGSEFKTLSEVQADQILKLFLNEFQEILNAI